MAVSRLIKWCRGHNAGPWQMQLHLTNFCNLECCFCPTRALVPAEKLDRKSELSDEEWVQLIDRGVKIGIGEFHICGGGEPFFFRQRAASVIGRIKQHSKYGELITNGTLLDEEIINKLVEIEWDKITFSLDAPVESVHDRIRGRRCFTRIVRNIRMLASVRKRIGRNKPRIEVHCVLCSLNYRYLPEMVGLCSKIGAESLVVQALNIWSDEIKRYSILKEEYKTLRDVLEKSGRLADKHNLSTNIGDFIKKDVMKKANRMDSAMREESERESLGQEKNRFISVPCFMPWYNISVFADGRVVPCFLLQDNGESLREKALDEIWYGDYFTRVRTQILSGNLARDCSRCNPLTMGKTGEIRNLLRSMIGGSHGR